MCLFGIINYNSHFCDSFRESTNNNPFPTFNSKSATTIPHHRPINTPPFLTGLTGVCVCVCVGYMINAHMTIPHTINAHRKMRTVIFAHMMIPHTDKLAHDHRRQGYFLISINLCVLTLFLVILYNSFISEIQKSQTHT